MSDLEQLLEIAKLGHALCATADCSHPWAKDFKNRLLVRIAKLPPHLRDEVLQPDYNPDTPNAQDMPRRQTTKGQ
jgi:hypothetical protein